MSSDTRNHDGIIGQSGIQDGHAPFLIAADKLTGEKVVSQTGDVLGEITHVMLDVAKGTIAYAVLSFGGWLGVGDKLFAVPWHALALDVDDKWFVMNVDKERLKNAPGFDKKQWPSMADPTWAEEVQAYYGPVAVTRRPFI